MAEIYDTYNEGSSFSLTVSFTDIDGNTAIPTSIFYEVYDSHTGTVLQESTGVAIGSSIIISVLSTVNVIVKEWRDKELHVLLVKTNYGLGDDLNDEYKFYVKNLRRV